MPALVAGIHALRRGRVVKTWMAGTSPAMTEPEISHPQKNDRVLIGNDRVKNGCRPIILASAKQMTAFDSKDSGRFGAGPPDSHRKSRSVFLLLFYFSDCQKTTARQAHRRAPTPGF